MAGDALPVPISHDPGIGEASVVLVGLSLIRSLGVIGADHDGGALIGKYLFVFVGDQ